MWVGFRMRVVAQGGLEAFQREVSERVSRRGETRMFEIKRSEAEVKGTDGLERMTLGEVLYFALFGEGMQTA